MSAISISSPFPTFTDVDGDPLESGYIYVGQANVDPVTFPITVYWDAALTIPAAQPIRTIGGYPARNGSPARIYANSDYSIRVTNKNGSLVYSAPAATDRFSGVVVDVDAADVAYTPAGTGAVATTVQSKLREAVSVKDFGAVGDGVADDGLSFQTALNWAIANRKSLYVPEGTYIIGGAGLINNRLEPTISDGDSLILFGAGPGKTIIKEKTGDTRIYGRYHTLFYVNIGASETLNNLIIKDITFDKNGASNGTPPTSYEWEQAHIIGVSTDVISGRVRYALFENIEMLDKVGGGIVLMAGNIDNAIIRNCNGRNFSGLFGQRGDFEFQASVKNFEAVGCTGLYAQCEPDATAPPAGVFPVAVFRDCTIDILEFTSYQGTADAIKAQTVLLDNCVAMGKLTVRNLKLVARNSKFVVGSGNNDFWQRLAPGSLVDECTIINRYNAGTNSIESLYPRNESTLGGFYCDFTNCLFEPGVGASTTTTGYAVNNANVYSGDQPFIVRFTNCDFNSMYEGSVYAYANGGYELIRCRISGRTLDAGKGSLVVGGWGSYYGNISLSDCDFSRSVATYNVRILNSNSLWALNFSGSHKYSEFKVLYSGVNPEDFTTFSGLFQSSSVPTAHGIKGMRVRITNPIYGNASEYVCTVSSLTATFRMSKQFGIKKDTTANRPALTASDVGAQHIDTTLSVNGKPITWTGSAWVDSTGVVV